MWDQGTARAPLWSKQIFSDGAKQYAKFDQIVIFDHILTALYGTNSYVYISDHDEFLVLPQSVAHPRVHNSIINGARGMFALCGHTHGIIRSTHNVQVVYG